MMPSFGMAETTRSMAAWISAGTFLPLGLTKEGFGEGRDIGCEAPGSLSDGSGGIARIIRMCNLYTIIMTATKRIPVSEEIWASLSDLKRPGETFDGLLAAMVDREKKARLFADMERIEAEEEFVELAD
jgi:predicted CopG family antitoxin